MTTPTIPDTHHDLFDLPVATLATVGPDGRPQLSAVWFVVEDDLVRISINTSRQKLKNLRSNPAATVFLIDPSGMRYLEIRGDVTLEADDDYEFADRVGSRYGGADLREMDAPGQSRVKVTLNPVRVNAVDMTGG